MLSTLIRFLCFDYNFHLLQRPGTNVDKVNMASSSFALSSVPTKNIVGSNPPGSTDTSHLGQGLGSNWISPLQRNTSAK